MSRICIFFNVTSPLLSFIDKCDLTPIIREIKHNIDQRPIKNDFSIAYNNFIKASVKYIIFENETFISNCPYIYI